MGSTSSPINYPTVQTYHASYAGIHSVVYMKDN